MVKISNFKLIKLLESNGRMSFVDLAKKFGVTEAAIRKRINELKKRGIIKKFRADVDYKKIGMVGVIVGVDTSPERYVHVVEKLKEFDEIFSLATSSGDHQIMFEASFRNSEEMTNFLKKVEKIDGVIKICPAVILERLK